MDQILNERQYRITKSWFRKFDAGPVLTDDQLKELAPHMVQAIEDSYRSQAEDLEKEIKEYEKLKQSGPENITLQTLEDLPHALIKLRIMRCLTQRELADRLGVSEQQIQRYEKIEYQGVGFNRILDILSALEVELAPTAFRERA